MFTYRGQLQRMDEKIITLLLDDHREVNFKRTDKTKFFKDGEELKSPKFAQGDQLSVEGPRDDAGFVTAVNVRWEKAAENLAAKSESSESKDSGAAGEPAANGAAPKSATATPPPPSKPDPDDPGPPVLRRGGPADPSRMQSKPIPAEAANAQPAATELAAAAARPSASPASASGQTDPIILKATEAAADFTETLPNYVCREVVARFYSETTPANWQPIDVLNLDLVYENGQENYRNVTVNGKAVNKSLEEIGGTWSTGEFGTILIGMFHPATAAQFHFQKSSRIAGIDAREYSYTVAQSSSNWKVRTEPQTYMPAYKGAVWLDPGTGRVLRIEMIGTGFPGDFPFDKVESAVDYEYVRLGGTQQFLLPVHAETLSCQRGSSRCSRNTMDFRNYHKFEGQSSIEFGDAK